MIFKYDSQFKKFSNLFLIREGTLEFLTKKCHFRLVFINYEMTLPLQWGCLFISSTTYSNRIRSRLEGFDEFSRSRKNGAGLRHNREISSWWPCLIIVLGIRDLGEVAAAGGSLISWHCTIV